ncbi:MAG: selenocysteine-specific translation elongation factor [Sandaracinaceae bacterium]
MIVGTAGHVNHGKTTLVEALTGVNCDRLAQERERGMTIELGFAQWALPSGRRVSVIDVPGHARFARTMASGAFGVDVALLVIAADEGWMPQTREHVNALHVLGVERVVVAMNRTDRVSDVAHAKAAIEAELTSTPYAGAPVLPVCAPLFEGLDSLGAAMDEALAEVDAAPSGPALLPVDRAFSVKGFGTVVTGSLVRGDVSVNDRLVVYPTGREVRVRTLHVHSESAERAEAKTRLALNLADATVASVPKGSIVARPGALLGGRVLDAEIEWLAHNAEPLKRASSLGWVSGPSRASARVQCDEPVAPGTRGLARVYLDRDAALFGGQRFVLRGKGDRERGAVVGGGRVIDARPPRSRKAPVRAALASAPSLDVLLDEAGPRGVSLDEVAARLGIVAPAGSGVAFSASSLETAEAALIERVQSFLQDDPDADGLAVERAAKKPIELAALERALARGALVRDANEVRTPEHRGARAAREAALGGTLVGKLAAAKLDAPREPEVEALLGVDAATAARVIAACDADGTIVRSQGFCFAASVLDPLRAEVARALIDEKSLGFGWLKDRYGLSRKHAMPIWTWLDRIGVSVRRGADSRAPGPAAKRFAS